MDFDAVGDRDEITVNDDRYLIVSVKQLANWRSMAIFDYESGRIAGEAERDGPPGSPYKVFLPLDDREIYVGHDIEEAIIRILEAE